MINIKNENDNECFRWCYLAYLFSDEINPQRISKYKKYINKVKYDRIDFPVKIKDIPKIENLNYDIRFNVYGVTKIKPFTLFILLIKFVIKLAIYF